ncbi:MAG TPA: SpoIIE family protein phosphatase [Bryobacteraceae bacterium]|nr:SpoIIE family protein phosphatase [Bryobacteraceae bacterium]
MVWNMAARLIALYRKLGRVEKVFLFLLLLYAGARLAAAGSGLALLAGLAVYAAGFVVALRLAKAGIARLIWRLRNRLIVAYLFIAVVPIVLILTLTATALYMVTGQVAVYLVSSELARRNQALQGIAEILARTPAGNRVEALRRGASFLNSRFPKVEMLFRESQEYRYPEGSRLTHPPAGWKDASGIMVKDRRLYSWAHVLSGAAEVTVVAPLTHDFLAGLVPELGDVFFITDPNSAHLRAGQVMLADDTRNAKADRVPAPFVAADIVVTGVNPTPVALWESPERWDSMVLVVHTRTSALLGILFGGKMDWGQIILVIFVGVVVLFVLVEIVSLVIGISLTRTITSAVHHLYEGTQRVKEGDFSHRIPVEGSDQLAELGISFNTMTENLERLIVVAKEKERLQSELEIAREVQSQLFPKQAPHLTSLEVTGVCNPARMVSGDYYDFQDLAEHKLAFAIGDVAGKGISAALLMAAIQSTMRTQLTASASARGNGSAPGRLSAAALVSLLNKQLYANTSAEKYATFYFALYDEETSTLTYTNAGHLPPILLHGGVPRMLDVTGTVVGAFPFTRYDEKQVELTSGDLVVGYTDGITEPENEYGEMFGEERLKDLLVKHARDDAPEIIARVMEAVQQWTGAGELQDDMTMLVARKR